MSNPAGPRLNAANNAKTHLAQDISAVNTSFLVVDASVFPPPPFLISVGEEIMEVGAVVLATNTLANVFRGREWTSAATHVSGSLIENRWTAGSYYEIADSGESEFTLDQELVPTQHTGLLGDILSWFANRIRAILGSANWFDNPATTLVAAHEHHMAPAPHTDHAPTHNAVFTGDTRLRAVDQHGNVLLDEFGISPEFIKRFPNKVENSSFERFELVQPPLSEGRIGKPDAWTGTGHVTNWSNWDGSFALYLAPGEFAEQDAAMAADPAWWDNMQTRVSFYLREGIVRASLVPAHTLTDNSGETPISGQFIDYTALNWARCSFWFMPTVGVGRVRIRFENVGLVRATVDAVQIEPDLTGMWASFYTHGPNSSTVEPDVLRINRQTGHYTLVTLDAYSTMIAMNNPAPANITIPPSFAPRGAQITIAQENTAQVTLVAGSGVTIRSADNALKTRARQSVIGITQMATNIWVVTGDAAV